MENQPQRYHHQCVTNYKLHSEHIISVELAGWSISPNLWLANQRLETPERKKLLNLSFCAILG